jgi:hypothetical protein
VSNLKFISDLHEFAERLTVKGNEVLLKVFNIFLNYDGDFLLFPAFWMEETTKYCPVDAILPDVQETKVPMGSTCRSSR